MLYKIQALKAPWPKDAKVGDIINMPSLASWAVGKCSVAPDDAVATVQYVEPEPAVDESLAIDPGAVAAAAHAEEIERVKAEEAEKRRALEDENAALRARVDEMDSKLAEADKVFVANVPPEADASSDEPAAKPVKGKHKA